MTLNAYQRYVNFCNTAPFHVQRLAALMSAVPVELYNLTLVLKMISKENGMGEENHTRLVSALFSSEILFLNSDQYCCDFYADEYADIRALLNKTLPARELAKVIDLVGVDLARQVGKSIDEFLESFSDESTPIQLRNFANVTKTVLSRMGEDYAFYAK